MIFLLDTSENHDEVQKELGCECGQLITPLTRRTNRGGIFAIDNGAYSEFKEDSFESLLEREKPNKNHCKFVAAPDVVCSAIRTLECFQLWYPRLESWPLALVLQNGQEALPIPWNFINAVFIGGDDQFKMSSEVKHMIKCAQIHRKWVHVGRINTPGRFDYFESLGCDSCDGTGVSMFSGMRGKIKFRGADMLIGGDCG